MGPGKYDPRHHYFDGAKIVPLNATSVPIDIPAIYGLKGVGFETITGDGPISYWNAYVGIGQMGGKGTFRDPRLKISIEQSPDLVTPKLKALLDYQLSLEAPKPPASSFDGAAASRPASVRAQGDLRSLPPRLDPHRRGDERQSGAPRPRGGRC